MNLGLVPYIAIFTFKTVTVQIYQYFAVLLQLKVDLVKENSQIERGSCSYCNSSLWELWYKSVFASWVVVFFLKKSVTFFQVIAFGGKGLNRTSSFKVALNITDKNHH